MQNLDAEASDVLDLTFLIIDQRFQGAFQDLLDRFDQRA
jgi:hypothetical protein